MTAGRARTSFSRKALLTTLAMLLGSCYQPARNADEVAREGDAIPLASDFREILDAHDASAPAMSCEGEPEGGMSFRVRTVSGAGRYRPRNVGAIWVEDVSGSFIKTLEHWGSLRAKWLTAFIESSGGDKTDAITGATLDAHRVHEVRWNFTDRSGCEVEDGAYRVRLEMTDKSGTGPTISLDFEKGAPAELAPEDQHPFLEMLLRVE